MYINVFVIFGRNVCRVVDEEILCDLASQLP